MRRTPLVAALLVSAFSSAAMADFVLFGESNKPEVEPNNQVVHPITSPYYNEDSFVTTDIRAWFVYARFLPECLASVAAQPKRNISSSPVMSKMHRMPPWSATASGSDRFS